MKVSKWILGLAAGALLLPVAVVAQNRPIQHRKHNQQKRIAQGVRSGSLTARETARLERNQVRLNRQERRMKSDGNFTARERARVNHQQNRLSRQIYRQKHDAQYR